MNQARLITGSFQCEAIMTWDSSAINHHLSFSPNQVLCNSVLWINEWRKPYYIQDFINWLLSPKYHFSKATCHLALGAGLLGQVLSKLSNLPEADGNQARWHEKIMWRSKSQLSLVISVPFLSIYLSILFLYFPLKLLFGRGETGGLGKEKEKEERD